MQLDTDGARLRWGIRYVFRSCCSLRAGWILFTVDDHIRWDGWAMRLGSAGAVLLLNLLFRYGARGDTERQAEETARAYFDEHGHWPDETPHR